MIACSLFPCNFTRSTRHLQIKLSLSNNDRPWKRSCEAATCHATVQPLCWSRFCRRCAGLSRVIHDPLPCLAASFSGAILWANALAVVAPTPLSDCTNFSISVLLFRSFNCFCSPFSPSFSWKALPYLAIGLTFTSPIWWTRAGVTHMNLASLW